MMKNRVSVYGKQYALPNWLISKKYPLVVVCLDGHDPTYVNHMSHGDMFSKKFTKRHDVHPSDSEPAVKRLPRSQTCITNKKHFLCRPASCVMPSFTNPNNVSIISGTIPAVHGICGNYFLNSEGEPVAMNSSKYFFPPPGNSAVSFLSAFQKQAGLKVGCITSKRKLLNLISADLDTYDFETLKVIRDGGGSKSPSSLSSKSDVDATAGPCFSMEDIGVDIYSPDATLKVFEHAAEIQENPATRCDVLYLTTTDYMQHKHSPFSGPIIDFYNRLDQRIGRLKKGEKGDGSNSSIVGITADHGMSQKPNILFLGDVIEKAAKECNYQFPAVARDDVRIILPITDPYVKHHGALGGCCWIHLLKNETTSQKQQKLQWIVDIVQKDVKRREEELGQSWEGPLLTEQVAAHIVKTGEPTPFHLPRERIGDIVFDAGETVAFGGYEEEHDLSDVKGTLRTHGGTSEVNVPLLLDRRLGYHGLGSTSVSDEEDATTGKLFNCDIFPLMLDTELL